MKIKFSPKISIIGGLLACAMLSLSYWQWQRYIAKEVFLAELDHRLNLPVTPLEELLDQVINNKLEWKDLLHRRALVSGEWDFKHEVIIRNRKDEEDGPGFHVVTPLILKDNQEKKSGILINRGYIPLAAKDKNKRKQFQESAPKSFYALIKLSEDPRYFISPNDPPAGKEYPWVDAWLRVNINEIGKQIPYSILPIQAEIISSSDSISIEGAVVKNSTAREDIFFMTDGKSRVVTGEIKKDKIYPTPAPSTVVPSATHLAYVFEWAFMAFLTILISFMLQLDRGVRRS